MSHTGAGPVFKRWLNLLRGAGIGPVSGCTDGPVWSSVGPLGGLSFITVPYCAAYGSGNFVMVANNGAGSVSARYSTDTGSTWLTSTVPVTAAGGQNVDFGNGTFVAGCSAIDLVRSTDGGVNWSAVALAFGAYLRVSFADGCFYLIQNAGIVRSATNGATWAAATYTGISTMNSNIASNGTKMVIAGHDTISAGFTIVSTDNGLTWNPSAVVPPWNNTTCPQKLLYVSSLGLYVAIGSASVASDNAYWSTDGENWNTATMASTAPGVNRWRDMVFADGQLLAVNSASTDVCRSTDGKTWTLSTNAMIAPGNIGSLAANGSRIYVAQRISGGSFNDARRGVC